MNYSTTTSSRSLHYIGHTCTLRRVYSVCSCWIAVADHHQLQFNWNRSIQQHRTRRAVLVYNNNNNTNNSKPPSWSFVVHIYRNIPVFFCTKKVMVLLRRVPFVFWKGIGRRHVFLGLLNVTVLSMVHRLLGAVSESQLELFYLYYQPCIPFLFMLWGWGVNVLYFERTGLKYDLCFEESERQYLLPGSDILKICNILTSGVLLSGAMFLGCMVFGNISLAAMQPVLLYVCALLVLVMPFPTFYRDTRRYFASTFWRVLTPVRRVGWGDFLLADILTSLAKGLSDIERAICSMVSGPIMLSGTHEQCSDASWTIPIGLALPYAWRLCQCVRVYLDTGNRQQLWNALKYTTAFPVVFLSFSKYHVTHDSWVGFWKPLWLCAACLNSLYSYFWDVERDWEISFFSRLFTRQRGSRRPVLPHPTQISRLTYHYLMVSNALLRLSWTYKLSPHLRRDHMVVFCIVILEAFRRFQWVFVRVEVEMRKIQASHPELGTLVPGARGARGRQQVHIMPPSPLGKGNLSP